MDPADFEELILRLLLSMGYGQGLDELASALGGSGDGGMDGVIHQDPLGLDRVYIQAKRYRDGNNVSSPDIRNFVGALNIHRATKGVFVTASQFTSDARAAAQGSTVQVVLIDGERLSDNRKARSNPAKNRPRQAPSSRARTVFVRATSNSL